MATETIEIRLTLAENIVQRLREMARARGTTEETIVAQALDLLIELDDTPPTQGLLVFGSSHARRLRSHARGLDGS